MADSNIIIEIMDRLPAIILAVSTLVAVIKGSDILTQGNEIKVETNRIKRQELGMRIKEDI